MFQLPRLEFLSLIGLFVQAFLAWVFVAILATMRRRERPSGAFDQFYFAFAALAVGLTVLSVRFFKLHLTGDSGGFWNNGQWAPTLCYIVYNALKGVFALLLVRGSYELIEKPPPRWLNAAGACAIAVLVAAPLALPDMTPLLVVQAPVMIAAALIALRALSSVSDESSGRRILRWALVGLALAWIVDSAAAALHARIPVLSYVVALNSFFDLGVQLALGTGLVICLLQVAHQRARAAEQERERLQRMLDRDEQLRALGTLVSGVAHELNNPLTVILGYADLLAATEGDNDAAKIVAEQAQRCRGIVRSLSALAGQSQHSLQEMHADEFLHRVVRGIGQSRDPSAPRVWLEPLPKLRFHADRVGMEQVLSNLIHNALQASPPGGSVAVSASALPAGIRFTVADQGPGIPEEHRAQLFEPFFTTKGPGKGTGLGLSIAHAIVRAHGGAIEVESGPEGRGTRFCVSLPHASGAPTSTRSPLVPARGARRLLIIDDEPGVRSVVRRQAELRGWTVGECESAESALSGEERLDGFDAVLCDLRMPGMGGAGLHDRLRSHAPAALARTIFVTGDLASPEAVQFSRRCTRPLVQKPFEFDELFGSVTGRPVHA